MPEMSQATRYTGDEVQPLPRVLLCGDFHTAEVELVAAELSLLSPAPVISTADDLTEIQLQLLNDDYPDLVVFVQTWPDALRFPDIISLPGIGPLTRLICCFGPWCVSDGRTRQNFPLAVTIPLEQFRANLASQWQQIVAPHAQLTSSPLAWTANRDEIFQARYSPQHATGELARSAGSRPTSVTPTVRVLSPDRELLRLWSDAAQTAGFSTSATQDEDDNQIILWDADVWTEATGLAWRALLHRCPATRIIALTGFMTPDLVTRLRDYGATKVLPKLLPLDDLCSEIAELTVDNGTESRI